MQNHIPDTRWSAALTVVILLWAIPAAHAGLTMQISVTHGNYHNDQYYQFQAVLNTNSTPPNVSFGDYFVVSPGWPTNANAAATLFQFDSTGFNQVSSTYNGFSLFDAPDFADSFIQNITNGQWTIFVTNAATTNIYHFNVAASIGSNALPLISVTFPTNGAVNVTNRPTLTWQGATNYDDQIIYLPNFGTDLPVTQNSFSGVTLLDGINSFTVDTYYLSSTGVVSSVPLDSASNAISSWVSTWHVWDYANVQFTVGSPDTSGSGHTLVAHYTWDATNADGSASGADSSGNGYNLNFTGSFGGAGGVNWTTDAEAGPGAIQFHDGDGNSGGHVGWNPMQTNVLAAIAGSFSISCWINTTQNLDYSGDYAYNGAGVVSAYTGGLANDVIPIALTGGQVAFNTGGDVEDDTLTSQGSVNDGNFHHVVVTRNQLTGQKLIYIDGAFDSFSSGTTNLLTDARLLTIGALADATDQNANDATYYNGYDGILDDLQIYSGMLSSNDVAYLYQNPGTTVGNAASFNAALSTTDLPWATSGDTSWFTENTNTYNGAPAAAQSGSVTGSRSSALSVTVTGPGTLSFYWASLDDCDSFDYEFAMDGTDEADISCDAPWGQFGPFTIPSGQHILSWTTYAYGDNDPTEAGFLDQVSYVSVPSLTVTASPLSGLAPLTVQFTSPGVDSAGNTVTNWSWIFGDGGTSTAQSPSYTYATAGSFSPSLTAYSTYGATPLTVNGPGLIVVTNPPNVAPGITVNPFNQTNYPGYGVALLAEASGYPVPAWQWFKTSAGLIAGATNNLYLPTSAGTVGVAGNYYAIASNLVGTANSTTAAVSFVSAPLPPDWSVAFKSPFINNNDPSEEFYISCFQDSTGNLYTAGVFFGTNSFGSTSYVSPNGTYSADVVKQTASGSPIWAVVFTNNGSGNSQPYTVVPAPGNGVYVAGNYNGTNWLGTNQLVDLGLGANGYYSSIFLARLDANGNPLWVRTISGTNYCFTEYYQLVSDAAGNVTLSGLFWGSTLFSSANAATGTNVFATGQQGGLAQYDANGALRWVEFVPSWINYMTYGGGRIYGTFGTPSTNYNFGGVNLVTDRGDSVVALNETNGQAIWLRGIGAPFGQDNPLNVNALWPLVAVSGTNVFIAGISVGSNAAFGTYTVSWPGFAHQYLARCDTNGTPQLITTFGSATTMPWTILADAAGGVYVSGDFDTYSFFGNDLIAGPHLDSIGSGYFSDGFLAKFDFNGNALWARTAVPQDNLVNLRGLALASDGVWACGAIKSPAAFGTNLVYGATTCIGSPCTPTYDYSGVLAKITDSAATAQPVILLNPQAAGGILQLSFLSQSGFSHNVQYRTNLIAGLNWQTYSNVLGDGTLKTIPIALSVFSPALQGYIRVSTQ